MVFRSSTSLPSLIKEALQCVNYKQVIKDTHKKTILETAPNRESRHQGIIKFNPPNGPFNWYYSSPLTNGLKLFSGYENIIYIADALNKALDYYITEGNRQVFKDKDGSVVFDTDWLK